MALDSYDGLKGDIVAWLDRDDLTQYVDTFIDLAEARFGREIRLRSKLTKTSLTIAQDDSEISAPADLLDVKYMRLQVPAGRHSRKYFPDFRQVAQQEMAERAIVEIGTPSCWSFEVTIELDRPADQEYTADLFYYTPLDPLSDTQATNELLTEHGDAYLYACLAASAPFMMHDERIPVWEALYGSIRDQINLREIKNKTGGPLVDRVGGIPNRQVR